MSFARLTIRTRLTALLVFVNVLLLSASGYAWYAIARLNGQLDHNLQVQDSVERAGDLSRRAQLAFKGQVQEWKNILIRGRDADLYDKHLKGFQERSATVKSLLVSLNESAKTVGLSANIADKAIAEHEELDKRYAEALAGFKAADPSTGYAVDKAIRGIDRAATDHIDALVKEFHDHGDALQAEAVRSAESEKTRLVIGLLTLAAIAVIVSGIAGTLTIMAITRRLKRATEVARVVASGNLATEIEPGRDDELGQLLSSLREMNGSLASIV